MKHSFLLQRQAVFLFCIIILGAFSVESLASTAEQAPGREMAKQATRGKKLWITADHSKHEVLKQEFKTGPEVTTACLSCHTEAALQFHKTIHWTWKDPTSPDDNKLGKGGLSVNNF